MTETALVATKRFGATFYILIPSKVIETKDFSVL